MPVIKTIQRRHPAFIIPIKSKKIERQRSSKIGTYRTEVTVDLARMFPDRMLTPAAIAKVHYGRATKDNEEHVRRLLWRTYTELQQLGELWYPVYSKAQHGQLIAIKRFSNDEIDQEAFDDYLHRALNKQEITKQHAEHLEAMRDEIKRRNGG
jgi:hypothetical protein